MIFSTYKEAIMTKEAVRDLRNKASKYMNDNMYNEALEVLDKAIKLESLNWLLFIQRAELHSHMKSYHEAISDYTQAIQLAPHSSNAYEYRGTAYHLFGNNTKAIDDFSKAIELSEDSSASLYGFRSFLYSELGRLDDAINDLDIAIKQSPRSFLYYFKRAKLFKQQDRLEAALNDLQVAKSLSEENSSEHQAIDLLVQKIKEIL